MLIKSVHFTYNLKYPRIDGTRRRVLYRGEDDKEDGINQHSCSPKLNYYLEDEDMKARDKQAQNFSEEV